MSDLLDLPVGIGQRFETVRWQLFDRNGRYSGELHPISSTTPNLNLDTTAPIMRTVRNISFDSDEYAQLDPFTDRVRPTWLLSDGTEFPLGELMFTDASSAISTRAGPLTTVLFDQGFLLDVPTDQSFGIPIGHDLTSSIIPLLQLTNVDMSRIDITLDGEVIVTQPMAWPTGSNWYQILKQLCDLAGLLSPYFDSQGTLVIRPPAPLSKQADLLIYSLENSRVVADSATLDDNLLSAPNEFVVVGNNVGSSHAGDPQPGEIVGRAFINPDAPNSKENTGRIIPSVSNEQGITDTTHAQALAQARANSSRHAFRTLTFASAPDPRHDVFDVVLFGDQFYNETQWNLPLIPGGAHTHTLTQASLV